MEIIFNTIQGRRFKTTAVCHIDGGPDYEVNLVGDASLISYKISGEKQND